jgi:3-oxoacyl-[acyl-carrier protein] reductase
MTGDTLLNLSSKPSTRWMVSMLGLPTPMPLDRADGPWEATPLADASVCLAAGAGATHAALTVAIEGTGAEAVVLGDDPTDNPRVHALVLDATGVSDVAGLRGLYDFFHPRIKSIGSCGRLIVVGRPADGSAEPAKAAVTHGIVGFVKSAAKELGRKGSTANLITPGPSSTSPRHFASFSPRAPPTSAVRPSTWVAEPAPPPQLQSPGRSLSQGRPR